MLMRISRVLGRGSLMELRCWHTLFIPICSLRAILQIRFVASKLRMRLSRHALSLARFASRVNRREILRLRVPALRAKTKAQDTSLGMTS